MGGTHKGHEVCLTGFGHFLVEFPGIGVENVEEIA